MIYPPSKAWQIGIPNLEQDPFNFTFSSNLPAGKFTFTFKWFNDQWNIWVTLPSGEIRQAGTFPNTVSWTGFFDFYVQFITTLAEIGQNDLNAITMVVYQI